MTRVTVSLVTEEQDTVASVPGVKEVKSDSGNEARRQVREVKVKRSPGEDIISQRAKI